MQDLDPMTPVPATLRMPSPEAIRAAIAATRPMVEDLFARLAAGSPGAPGILRDTYGPGESFAHRLFAEVAGGMGLEIGTDLAANTYATLPGRDRGAPRLIIGSHLDSVPHGGNFDGAAGVIAGLVTIAALRALTIAPACDITVMGVRAEESIWFAVSYIGSRAALGTLPDAAWAAKRFDTGRALAAHMRECGADPEAIRRGERHLDPRAIRAFLEVHIEQAPSLVETGLPVAICTGIPGNFRYPDAMIIGRHDHVGTPRRFRQDAAMAGAEFAMLADRIWAEEEAAGNPMAATFGRFHTDPAQHGLTIVPGAFRFSLDVRAYDQGVLDRVEARMLAAIPAIEARRGVRFALGARASAAVGPVAPEIAAALEAGAATLGVPIMRLGSPASHDAAAFAAAGVPMAMLFVRNENGSHNPDEAMEIDDFLEACAILAHFVIADQGASP